MVQATWWVWWVACGVTERPSVAPGLPVPVERTAVPFDLGGVPASSLPDLAERVTRSVVSINVKRPSTASYDAIPQHGRLPDGVGSGVVVRADGIVLSNHHVVNGATSLELVLSDGRRAPATVVGSDENTDVAVLRITDPPPDLSPIDFGVSEKLRVGEVVLAIGNPFGVGQTVTLGIVSALGRSGLGLAEYEDFIQTDAAINPGNSGGALVDLSGRLIGINSAIRSEGGGSEGIGFAIPVDRVRRVAETILEKGKVERGFLGVSLEAREPTSERPGGVVVSQVLPGSAAADAGFEEGDLVVSLDGRAVDDVQRFRYEVGTSGPGHPFEIVVDRSGASKVLRGTYASLPENGGVAALDSVSGARLVGLDEFRHAHPELPTGVEGLAFVEVGPGPFADAGIEVGDVLLTVDGAVMTLPGSFTQYWRRAAGGMVVLQLLRGADLRLVTVTAQ